MPYVPPPDVPPAFPDLRSVRRKTHFAGGLRKRWKDAAGNIYEWDYLHGTVEKFGARGRHLGEYDPDTGEQISDADPNRTVEP